ncbi:MAG TPA: right-handed parallel beta-helix repeat-containing protein [Streptosporangiaceae bacterium]|jgi:parallel beta-helix repeat protein
MVGGTLAALTPLAQATSTGTLYVSTTGTDSGTCRLPANPCQTISYALTKAPSGATIKVAAGDYPQPLQITQAVTIIGAGSTSAGTVIDPATLITDSDTDSSTPQDAVIDIPSTTGVTLKSIDVDGENALGNFTGCGTDFVGVYYHDSSGALTGVQVTNIQLPQSLFGCQDGQGVYVASDAGDTSSVDMTRLNVNTFDKNGVTCDDAGTTCSLVSSKVTGIGETPTIAQNGFQGFDAASVTLTSDTIKGNSYTGGGAGNSASGILIYDVGSVSLTTNTVTTSDVDIYLGDDGTGPTAGAWTINGNTVTKGTDNVPGGAQGYGDGIDVDSTSNPVRISDNTVSSDAEYGIALTGASHALVTGNTVTRNKSDGIYVGGPGSADNTSSSNTISDNASNGNKGDGILADTNSAANLFESNTAYQNVNYDLEDLGSANTWTSNTCRPAHDSNPSGLC